MAPVEVDGVVFSGYPVASPQRIQLEELMSSSRFRVFKLVYDSGLWWLAKKVASPK